VNRIHKSGNECIGSVNIAILTSQISWLDHHRPLLLMNHNIQPLPLPTSLLHELPYEETSDANPSVAPKRLHVDRSGRGSRPNQFFLKTNLKGQVLVA
jgi:hypothetical protein